MDDLQFYIIFNSISVLSGRWLADNERLCAMEPLLRSERFPPQARLEPGTGRSKGQRYYTLCPVGNDMEYERAL